MNAPLSLGQFEIDLSVEDLSGIIDGMSLKEMMAGAVQPGHEDRIGYYSYVHSGTAFFPCDPRPEEVFLEDISWGLARTARFAGHTVRFMSVAEHCWIASYLVPAEFALEALLHDAAEAYIGDMVRPLKNLPLYGKVYLKIERGIEAAVAKRYGLAFDAEAAWAWPACVKQADEAMVKLEIAQNIKLPFVSIHHDDTTKVAQTKLHYWAPDLAQQMFEARFMELAIQRGMV